VVNVATNYDRGVVQSCNLQSDCSRVTAYVKHSLTEEQVVVLRVRSNSSITSYIFSKEQALHEQVKSRVLEGCRGLQFCEIAQLVAVEFLPDMLRHSVLLEVGQGKTFEEGL